MLSDSRPWRDPKDTPTPPTTVACRDTDRWRAVGEREIYPEDQVNLHQVIRQ